MNFTELLIFFSLFGIMWVLDQLVSVLTTLLKISQPQYIYNRTERLKRKKKNLASRSHEVSKVIVKTILWPKLTFANLFLEY